MSIVRKIQGREALPVWALPYVVYPGWGVRVAFEEVLQSLTHEDYGRMAPAFLTAYKLNEDGDTVAINPIEWGRPLDYVAMITGDLKSSEGEYEYKNYPVWLDSVAKAMPTQAFVFLDDLSVWHYEFIEKQVDEDSGKIRRMKLISTGEITEQEVTYRREEYALSLDPNIDGEVREKHKAWFDDTKARHTPKTWIADGGKNKIRRKWYQIQDAAEIIGCKVDDIIHYGATRQIGIYALTCNWPVEPLKIKQDGTEIRCRRIACNEPLRITPKDLLAYEANHTALAKGAWLPTVDEDKYFAAFLYPRPENPLDLQMADYDKKRISDMKLVIMADDLTTLQANLSGRFEENNISDQSANDDLDPKKREHLLRTIGALSLLLIEKADGKKFGTRANPNRNGIFKGIDGLLVDMEVSTDGQGHSKLSDLLKEAIELTLKKPIR